MKSTLLFCILFSISICCFAQKHTLTGTIYDEDKNVLTEANVLLKNATEGIITNKKGQFTLDINSKDILVISYLGFETKEVVVGDQKEITIILKSEWEKLEAVEIVGFKTTTKHIMYCRGCFSRTSCLVNQEGNDEESNKEFKRISSEHRLISLFPNPSATGLFQLQLDKTYNNLTVEIFNMNGQLIQTTTHTKRSKIPQIDLSTQPKGIYLIRTTADEKVLETKKAVKL